MTFKQSRIIIPLIVLLLIPAGAFAQDAARDSIARHDYARSPLPSGRFRSDADTIDTDNPDIKVVLYGDYTWKYIKSQEAAMSNIIFSDNMNEKVIDCYRTPLDSLPYSWTLWVVDSLGQYCCPNKTSRSSGYGVRHGRRHQGTDLPLHTGDPVYAAFDGMVRMSEYHGGYGNMVLIRHENGLETLYGHLSERLVNPGQWVSAGQIIGKGGSTGRSTGPHLHFETRSQGYAFDPERLIDFSTGTLRHRMFTLRKRYFDANSKYVQSDDDEEAIIRGDEEDRRKAEEERRKQEAAQQQWHTIRSGDTLGSIAKKYHTTVKAICRLNSGITERTTLRVGKRIRVR